MPESAFKGTVKEGFERRFTIVNERDFRKYVPIPVQDAFIRKFNNVADWIEDGRIKEGKNPNNSYVVINLDEPYIDEVIAIMKRNGQWGGTDVKECDYCDEPAKKLRPSPFMADGAAMMCKNCWDMTQKEYAASQDEHIGDFEDYPHF